MFLSLHWVYLFLLQRTLSSYWFGTKMGPFWFSQKWGLCWLWKALFTSTGVIPSAQRGHQSRHLEITTCTRKWRILYPLEPILLLCVHLHLHGGHQMLQPAEPYHNVRKPRWRGWPLCPEPFLQIEESLKLEFTNESLMFEVLQNKMSQMSEKFVSNIVLNQSHSFCKDKTFLVNLITCAF